MKNYSIMLKPASSLCDLRCRYCFYADVAARRSVRSFGMMQDSVLRRIMENIARSVAPGDHITLMFQGGEPMLAGLDFFRMLTEIADSWPSGISVSYALQTNAMHLDEAWCLFLKKHEFLVGVSHDLLAAQHNAARVDASGAPTMQRVERSISLLRKHDIAFNVLCTLTNPLARPPAAGLEADRTAESPVCAVHAVSGISGANGKKPMGDHAGAFCELLQWALSALAGRSPRRTLPQHQTV